MSTAAPWPPRQVVIRTGAAEVRGFAILARLCARPLQTARLLKQRVAIRLLFELLAVGIIDDSALVRQEVLETHMYMHTHAHAHAHAHT